MNTVSYKYKIGDTVFVYTPKGMEQKQIQSVFISILDDTQRVSYRIEEYGALYSESDIVGTTIKQAKKQIKNNLERLQATLELN